MSEPSGPPRSPENEPSNTSNAPEQPPVPINVDDPRIAATIDRYWQSNIRIMAVLLLIWAAAGLGCGILFADWLNQFKLPGTGYPLGFWFAQQGSIAIFVVLILIYCILLNRLDRKHHRELEQLRNGNGNNHNHANSQQGGAA